MKCRFLKTIMGCPNQKSKQIYADVLTLFSSNTQALWLAYALVCVTSSLKLQMTLVVSIVALGLYAFQTIPFVWLNKRNSLGLRTLSDDTFSRLKLPRENISKMKQTFYFQNYWENYHFYLITYDLLRALSSKKNKIKSIIQNGCNIYNSL